MIKGTTANPATIWAKTIQALPQQQMKFALNAALDTLPHNANLHLWKKKESDACPLCGERQTLIHALSCCEAARDLRRYNTRHDMVLQCCTNTIHENLPPTTHFTADLDSGYNFPTHIAPTDLRPDIAWWNEEERKLWIVELTVPFETGFDNARERKETKYEELVLSARNNGYETTLLTLEVGARGVPSMLGFKKLQHTLSLTNHQLKSLLANCVQKAIEGSFLIWTNRNKLSE